jgi:hypothetical protein
MSGASSATCMNSDLDHDNAQSVAWWQSATGRFSNRASRHFMLIEIIDRNRSEFIINIDLQSEPPIGDPIYILNSQRYMSIRDPIVLLNQNVVLHIVQKMIVIKFMTQTMKIECLDDSDIFILPGADRSTATASHGTKAVSATLSICSRE